jgi:hypothetical protein
MFTVDDKLQPIELCELSTVVITVHGSTLLAWWLYVQSVLYYWCNSYVGVSCMSCEDTCKIHVGLLQQSFFLIIAHVWFNVLETITIYIDTGKKLL